MFFLDAFNNSNLDPVLFNISSEIIDSSLPDIKPIESVIADSNEIVCRSGVKLTTFFPFFKVFLFFLSALVIASVLVGFNLFIVLNRSNNRKNSPYECGFEPVGSPMSNFEPNFVTIALVFLIYDVEILLTYPFAVGLRGQPISALFIFLLFIIILLISYAYEVLDGSFDI